MNSNIENFNNFYNETSKEINILLKEYNENLIKDKTGYLKENLEYLKNLNSDGKLIRGILIALGYKMMKEDIKYSYNLSLAYELFQTSILIHDDIIDNDNLRRGKDTIHYANFKKYKHFNEIEAKKTSESIGICIGDYGFYKVNEIIYKNYKNNPNFIKLLEYYNDIVLKTIEGELIDVVLSFEGKYKENEKLKDIQSFGEKIGIAFQIQDDILGIYSDMGKVIGSDIKEFKQTILYSYTINNEKYKNELLKYYGKENINEKEINETRKIFKDSGAYDYAVNLMNKFYDESIEIVKNINWIKNEDKLIIYGFIEYLKGRKL